MRLVLNAHDFRYLMSVPAQIHITMFFDNSTYGITYVQV